MIYEFGDRLKALRKDRGLSQQDVADYLNVSRPTVSGYESNENQPPVDTLAKLAALYGSSVDYILGLDKVQLPSITGLTEDEQNTIIEINQMISKLMNGRNNE